MSVAIYCGSCTFLLKAARSCPVRIVRSYQTIVNLNYLCTTIRSYRLPLSTPQWLPINIKYQSIFYLGFRWIMAVYFFCWLVPSGHEGGVKFFIFLTNWSFLAWNIHLIFSAVSATITVCLVYCCPSYTGDSTSTLMENPKPYIDIDVPIGCCGREGDATRWYHKIQWVLFNLGVNMAVVVPLLYWTLLYSGGSVDGINANTHLVNGIIALVDVSFSGVPVRVLHFIYPLMFSSAYVVFTGIYFAVDGTNVMGDPYIYPVIDYEKSPGSAAGWVLAGCLIIIPLVNLLLFFLYSVRLFITYQICARRESPTQQSDRI